MKTRISCSGLIGLWISTWVVTFIMAFWDAALTMWFLSATGIPALALGYWPLYWINLAIMMPVGTAVALGLNAHKNLYG